MRKLRVTLAVITLSVCAAGYFLSGCTKQQKDSMNEPVNSVSNFVHKTQSLISENNYTGLAREVDFSTTKMFTAGESKVFHTALTPSKHFSRALISIIRPDNRVLQYIIVVDKVGENTISNKLYSLSGKSFGYYRIASGLVTFSPPEKKQMMTEDGWQEPYFDEDGDMWEVSPPGPETMGLGAWWSCTRECISDVKVACYMDSFCATMLIISNAGINLSGQGNIAIGASCGIACASNSAMDLLPQY